MCTVTDVLIDIIWLFTLQTAYKANKRAQTPRRPKSQQKVICDVQIQNVTSRVDYCNLLLAGAPKSVTDKLQRVMNAAARVVSGTKKYDRGLTHLLHSELHWLDVADRVTYKLG